MSGREGQAWGMSSGVRTSFFGGTGEVVPGCGNRLILWKEDKAEYNECSDFHNDLVRKLV